MRAGTFLCALLALTGCDSGSGEGEAGDGGLPGDGGISTDGGTAGDGGAPNVPYSGDLPALPAGEEVDRQSHFPVNEGAVWRYRKKADQWQNPPPVTQGGETTIEPGEGEDEVVRRTVTIIDLEVEGEMTRVRQEIAETLVVTPSMELVGPKIEFKSIRIEEREVGTDRFVRVLEREYLPPYTLIEDTWKVGLIFTQISDNMIRMTERLQLRGMEEPMENSGLIDLKVETAPVGEDEGAILTMECQFREGVREITVFDDFTGAATRSYWVQQGVGPVQWRFRDTNNITFTLTETNLESDPAPCPVPE